LRPKKNQPELAALFISRNGASPSTERHRRDDRLAHGSSLFLCGQALLRSKTFLVLERLLVGVHSPISANERALRMKRTRIKWLVLSGVMLLLVVTPLLCSASPADQLAGHWEAELQGEGRVFTFIFEFKTNGDAVTGTVELSTQDRVFDITDGKIKGNSVSFKAIGLWSGTIKGDELDLTRELDYGKKQHMTAHRKKS